MGQKEFYAIFTYYSPGIIKRQSNASSKEEIRKMSYNKVNNKKARNNRTFYKEAEVTQVMRKLRLNPEQTGYLLNSPIGMSEKQWKNFSNKKEESVKKKLLKHAVLGLLPGETNVEVEIFV